MATENSFDSWIKNAKYTVTREFTSLFDKNSEKGLPLAVESSSTDVVKTDSHLDFQEQENLSNEDDMVELESRVLNKLQLLRNLESVVMNEIVVDDGYEVDDTAVISIPGLGHLNKATYSREELLAMRFIGVVKQKRLWRHIYHGLLASVAQEYAGLVIDIKKNPNPTTLLALHPNIIITRIPFYAHQGSSPASSTT